MSIFRRKRSDEGAADPSPAERPARTEFEPAPYYVAGMPSLHGQADGAVAEPAQAAGAPTSVTDLAAQQDAVDDSRVDPAMPEGAEEPVEQIAPVSRGGRNMPVAAIVGLALLGLVVAAAWYHPAAFAALACLVCVAAVVEWRRVLARSARRVPMTPILLATVGLVVATWYGGPEGLVVALMVGCAGTVAWRVVDERIENTLADSLAAMLTLLWIPFLAAFLILLELADDGWQRVIIVVVAVGGADTGGLFAGMLFGKHPMAPRVSPKKTWEGFAGGMLLGVGVAAVAAYYFFEGRWWIGAAVGVACVLAAVLGDLAESAVKRDIQVKDMSSALPGHGGVMDRIDSLLFAAPVAYVIFALMLGSQ